MIFLGSKYRTRPLLTYNLALDVEHGSDYETPTGFGFGRNSQPRSCKVNAKHGMDGTSFAKF